MSAQLAAARALQAAQRRAIEGSPRPGLSKTERVVALAVVELAGNGVITEAQSCAVVNCIAVEAGGLIGFSRHDVMAAVRTAFALGAASGAAPPVTPSPEPRRAQSATDGR